MLWCVMVVFPRCGAAWHPRVWPRETKFSSKWPELITQCVLVLLFTPVAACSRVCVCVWLKGEVGDTVEGLVVCLSILKVYLRMNRFNCICRACLFSCLPTCPSACRWWWWCPELRRPQSPVGLDFIFCFVFSSVYPFKQDFFSRCRTDLSRTSWHLYDEFGSFRLSWLANAADAFVAWDGIRLDVGSRV